MLIRFENFTKQIRSYLDEAIDDMCKGLSSDKQDEIIESYFHELKENNYNFYKHLIGMMFSDHYKILKDDERFNHIDDNGKSLLEIYSYFHDIDDVLNYVEDTPNALSDFLYGMSVFNGYDDDFDRRQVWLSCKDDLEFLIKFSPLNVFDYLYYCGKYSVERFKAIYDDYTSTDKSLIGSFEKIKDDLNELKDADPDNYFEVLSELLSLYYITIKDDIDKIKLQQDKDRAKKIIAEIENSSTKEVVKYIDDDKFLDVIFSQVFNSQNKMLDKDYEDDDVYNKTLQKLRSIKNYVKE